MDFFSYQSSGINKFLISKTFLLLSTLILNSLFITDHPPHTFPIFGGGFNKLKSDGGFMTKEQHDKILVRLHKKIDSLKIVGIIPDTVSRMATVLQWPLITTLSDYGYHRMGHFPDHNTRTNRLRDYMGGNRTYDRQGYNHAGTDFYGWPFSWHKMDNSEVVVVAAAPGVIIDKEDGNYDRRCYDLNNGTFDFNSIYIRHADGTCAWYVHFKKNSLTTKGIGQSVQTGAYLGIIGASGWAWEPHLHFEISRVEDDHGGDHMIDPNIGPINENPQVRWSTNVQRPYYDSAINKVMTHFAPPNFDVPCPTPAIINAQDEFNPGDTVYVAAYYRDQLSGQTSQFTIYKPDGTIFQTWTHNIDEDFPHPSTWEPDWSNASHWYWGWQLPLNAPGGTWKVEVVYEGMTYEHNFIIYGDDGLPVFLTSFELEQKENNILLTWNTESEINNQGFIIKRKINDASQYFEISSYLYNPGLIGKGTHSGNSGYNFTDENILPDQYYQYQLLSVSFSGKEEVIASKEIQTNANSISPIPSIAQLYQNYPNPFNGYTVISYFLPEVMAVNISVYNSLGQKIATLENSRKKMGNYKILWNTSDNHINSGIYYIILKTSKTTITNKCVIIN